MVPVPWLWMMQIPALHTGGAVSVTVSRVLICTVCGPTAAAAGTGTRAMPARGIAAKRVRERWNAFMLSSVNQCGAAAWLPPRLRGRAWYWHRGIPSS